MDNLPQKIQIADKQATVIRFNSVPVVTTEQLAQFYETDTIRIQQNYIRNAQRFVEGKHYFKVTGQELKDFVTSLKIVANSQVEISNKVRTLVLWTEKGAARHAKILDTDQAWEVFEQLEEVYFSLKEQAQSNFPTLPDFTNPAEAARAWAEQFEAKQLAEKQIAELAPKAEALETIADTTGMYCLRECAKTIGIKESELIQLLIDKKWIYRDADRKLQPYAQYLLNGVFKNRTSPEITNKNTGERKVYLHMRVTAFGLTRITGLVNKWRKAQQVAA